MHQPQPATDPPSLTWAREQIAQAVARWLKVGGHKKWTAQEMASLGEADAHGYTPDTSGTSSSSSFSSLLLALGSLCLGAVVGAAVSMLLMLGPERRRQRHGVHHDLPVSASAQGALAAPLLRMAEAVEE